MRTNWFRSLLATSVIVLASAVPLAKARAAEPDGMSELRRAFSPAGAPNFRATLQERTTASVIMSTRTLAKTEVIDGAVRIERQENEFHRLTSMQCAIAVAATDFFAGILSERSDKTMRCTMKPGSQPASLHSEIKLGSVTDVSGQLFPLAVGNELRFVTKSDGPFASVIAPEGIAHRLTVVDVLEGATLNVTGGPDVIYLIRHEENYSKTDRPFLIDIYWSAALRWPIQVRVRSHAANVTLNETNLVRVAGVGAYSLPDGRASSGFDRMPADTWASDIAAITDKLKAAMAAEKNEAGRENTRHEVGLLVDPTARPSDHLKPAFRSIAPFVTIPEQAAR